MNSDKRQMRVLSPRRGLIVINCFPAERAFMASLARNLRRYARQYGDPKPTLADLRTRAAGRYL